MKGDEHCHWFESLDGHILKKADNGYLVYAQEADARVVASAIPYTGNDSQAAGRIKLLDRQSMMKLKKSQTSNNLQIEGTFPTTGRRKLLMLLVNFADTQVTFGRDDFERMMNEENYQGTGSFRDFYLENS